MPQSARAIRSDIVEAAAKVFGTHGYERATLDEIASIVGMQKGSLYYHIASKEELLFAIHLKLWDILSARLTKAMADPDDDPLAQLEGVIRAIVETVTGNREMVRVFLRDKGALSERNSQYLAKNRASVLKQIEGIIGRIERNGVSGNGSSHTIAAYGILGMTYFVNEWYKPGQHSPDAIARTFAKMVIDGFAGSGAKASGTKRATKAPRSRAASLSEA